VDVALIRGACGDTLDVLASDHFRSVRVTNLLEEFTMQRATLGLLLLSLNLPALAHEGHGVDAGSVLHYLSGAHLLLPVGIGLAVAACYAGVRYFRRR